MYRVIGRGTPLRGLTVAALACALGGGACLCAQPATSGRKTMPDAQVQANVLKALAGASDLANQPITTTTVYGVVTLSGSVQTEALRTEAETLTSRAAGVQKVVDEMTLSNATAQASPEAEAPGDDPTGPAGENAEQGAQGSPASDNTAAANESSNGGQPTPPPYGPGAPEYGQQQGPPQGSYAQEQGQPRPDGYTQVRRNYPAQRSYEGDPQGYGGQAGGEVVTVPSGAMLRIRINQTLDSGRTQPGTTFDGIVVNDVVADGSVAIPRGATVHGTVVDAKSSGALKGRGELSLQLTEVTLAGKTYPLVSNVWNHHGGDKSTETVNKTILGGGIGALFGAAVGGGPGAAIGAGVGGALGLGSSAASGHGQVFVPSEGMLTFQLAQPATVATVSQQEMDRLAQGVPPGAERPQLRRRMYPYPVYGPVYRPYPYARYPYPYYPY